MTRVMSQYYFLMEEGCDEITLSSCDSPADYRFRTQGSGLLDVVTVRLYRSDDAEHDTWREYELADTDNATFWVDGVQSGPAYSYTLVTSTNGTITIEDGAAIFASYDLVVVVDSQGCEHSLDVTPFVIGGA